MAFSFRNPAFRNSFHNPAFRKAAIPLAILVVALIVLTVLLSRNKELNARHAPVDFRETFDFANGSFDDYIAWSERRVRAAQDGAADMAFIPNLLPFRFEPAADCPRSATDRYRTGVVLTHDVLDSAYMMRILGTYFQRRCFLVLGLLLPGHGSRPGELLQSDWEDWAAAEAFAARELAAEVEFPYLAGHGAGGTLALLEASRNPQISGLMLFAPQLDTRLPPWQATAASALGWLVPAARWAHTVPAYTPYRYEARPWRLTREVNALVAATLDAVPRRQVEVPVFLVATTEDADARTEPMLAYMAERVHPLSLMLLYSPQPLPVGPRVRVQLSNTLVKGGILGASHLGLMIPLFDPNFGWNGAVHDCGHYYWAARATYEACREEGGDVFGELTDENLQKGVLERLQFNPFYADMTALLDEFLGPAARIPVIQKI